MRRGRTGRRLDVTSVRGRRRAGRLRWMSLDDFFRVSLSRPAPLRGLDWHTYRSLPCATSSRISAGCRSAPNTPSSAKRADIRINHGDTEDTELACAARPLVKISLLLKEKRCRGNAKDITRAPGSCTSVHEPKVRESTGNAALGQAAEPPCPPCLSG